MKTDTTERTISAHFPLRIALALVRARGLDEIDAINHAAALEGLVRPSTDSSRFSDFAREAFMARTRRGV